MQQAELPQPTIAAAWDSVGADWLSAMKRGDFTAAWQASDRALALRSPAERDDPALPYHLRWVWDGSPVEGRNVLVRCYHGLGDTLQFCRYLPALRARAAHVTLEVQAELVPLMGLVGGADRIVPFDLAAPCPAAECELEIMELAHALRIAPVPVPYLPLARGPAAEVARVGVCWKVNSEWRPERSMRDGDVATFGAALGGVAGVELQSLQAGAALPGMAACPRALVETARTIAGLDLVVTVDTMVAHLAGAIGVPVWLLLEAAPDWRWLAGDRGSPRESPWYRNVRKYWQVADDDWGSPMCAIMKDLTRLIQRGNCRGRAGFIAPHG